MIKKGLKVRVLSGRDKKKEGEVIEIDRPNNRAKVKDINIVKIPWEVELKSLRSGILGEIFNYSGSILETF